VFDFKLGSHSLEFVGFELAAIIGPNNQTMFTLAFQQR
jgi:hypothetical protein